MVNNADEQIRRAQRVRGGEWTEMALETLKKGALFLDAMKTRSGEEMMKILDGELKKVVRKTLAADLEPGSKEDISLRAELKAYINITQKVAEITAQHSKNLEKWNQTVGGV